MVIEFDVTHNEIEAGDCCDPERCAVALAIGWKTKDQYRVLVSSKEATLFPNKPDPLLDEEALFTAELPLEIANWIVDFDLEGMDRKAIHPISGLLEFKPAQPTAHDEFMEIVRSTEDSA